jgi:hypothetical protein
MSKRKGPGNKEGGSGESARKVAPRPPEAVNVVDGIPDRDERPGWWKYAILAALFLAWLGFLTYCALAAWR